MRRPLSLPRLSPATAAGLTRWGPPVLASLVIAGWILSNLRAPIVEDSLFWWVPQALIVAERGPELSPAGTLPTLMQAGLEGGSLPSQWSDGIPDYAHPPLWFWYLGAWLALFGAKVEVIHLACLPLGLAFGLGMVALARRVGNPWAGLAPLGLPPVLAQLLRPELDLPLLALLPWALVALADGRWRLFFGLGLLAPWLKEPGVLFVVPALGFAFQASRTETGKHSLFPWVSAISPLMGLALWRLVHGGLAGAERLPAGFGAYLLEDLPAALVLAFAHQGRWVLWLGLPLLLQRRHRLSVPPLVLFVGVWVVFFSIVGFRLQENNPEPITHVRYFLPALVVLAVLLGQRGFWLALGGLFFLHDRSPYGPEASLFGVDAARAEASAVTWIRSQLEVGRRVWVGRYQAAALSQPWAGHTDTPVSGFQVFSPETDVMSLSSGDLVLRAAYGEPLGPLQMYWRMEGSRTWKLHDALVAALEVKDRTPEGDSLAKEAAAAGKGDGAPDPNGMPPAPEPVPPPPDHPPEPPPPEGAPPEGVAPEGAAPPGAPGGGPQTLPPAPEPVPPPPEHPPEPPPPEGSRPPTGGPG